MTLAKRTHRWLVLVASASSFATAGLAQQVNGTVRQAGNGLGVPGVILIAVTPEGDSVVARTISGAAGQFVLRVPPREVRIRALRIGHRPTDLGLLALSSGQSRRIDFDLVDSPVLLQAVTTSATSRCDLPAQARGTVADLFEEARKTLVSTVLLPPEGVPAARVALVHDITDLRGRALEPARFELRTGATAKPFRSLPAGLLDVVGYVSQDGDETIYRAPDAQVLLSNEFAASHCLQLVAEQESPRGLVGLAFRPSARPVDDIVRIRGTMWLDKVSFELTRVDFEYDGLPPELGRAGLGGHVSFTRLDDGITFESAWEIRMPRVVERRRPAMSGTITTVVVEAIQRIRGEVLSLTRDDSRIFVGDAALEDSLLFLSSAAVATLGDEAAVGGVDIGVFDPSCTVDDADGEPRSTIFGAVLDGPSRRLPSATVTAAWKDDFSQAGPHQWRWINRTLTTTSRSDGTYALCGAPRARLVTMSARSGERRSRNIALRIPMHQARARADIRFASTTPNRTGRTVSVVVRDVTGSPIQFAVVSVDGATPRVADADGRLSVPSDERNEYRLFVRRIGFTPFDGVVRPNADGTLEVSLPPAPRSLDAVTVSASPDSPLIRSGFYDRIEQAQRGAFVAEFITPEEIRERAAGRASLLLSGRRHVRIGASKEGRPRTIALGRGGCPMTVLVDGQRVNLDLTPEEQAVPIDDIVHGQEISAIEIYASNANAPAELVPLTGGGSCGIIAIWTASP